MKVLLIGGHGQLGTEIRKHIASRHPDWELHAPQRAGFDITLPVDRAVWLDRACGWRCVINCAAYHKVEACQENPDIAVAVNATAVHALARRCAENSIHLIHVSTDYVFGSRHPPRWMLTETDQTAPLNVYGASKLIGESLIATTGCTYTVARVASLFGHAGSSGKGGNFVETMIRKAKAGEPISVVGDVWMSPTHAADAARAIVAMADRTVTGTFHVVNRGAASWHVLARHVLREAGFKEYPVADHRAADKPGPVERPAWSVLSPQKLESSAGVLMRTWQEAVIDYVRNRP